MWGEIREICFQSGSEVRDYVAAVAGGERRGGEGAMRSRREEGRVTSDPADRPILSFRRPLLSLLFTSPKERRGG